ncbi:MAG: hypothetical protein ABFC57_10815 [Veillonellales bacterium]
MNQKNIRMLNQIIEDFPQFKENSLLYSEIASALDCKLSEAKKYAATHCNMLSMWAIFRASERYNKSYSEYFSTCLKENICTVKGYINDKIKMLEVLGIESSLETFREYEDILNPSARFNENKFYQVKIKANTSGDHFMACYIQENKLYLSDLSYRGIGVIATDFITEKNFQKIAEV